MNSFAEWPEGSGSR